MVARLKTHDSFKEKEITKCWKKGLFGTRTDRANAMIDNVFWLVKISLGVIGIWLFYSSTKPGKPHHFFSGVTLLLLALFMTGTEMITYSEAPWAYLILSGSGGDWLKAFFGGSLMLMLPAILLAVCGKNIARLSN